MNELLNFEYFKLIKEAEERLESFLDEIYESKINESILGAIASGNPIKYSKIKKAAAKYQQALVQISINDLDFEKKKAAGTLDPKQKDVLIAANKQKNQALKDEASARSEEMDQYATTPALKSVAAIAKSKSKIAAAELAAKTADGEEAKALKLKIQGLNKKIKASQEELEDYEESDGKGDQAIDNVKTDSGETVKDQKDKEEKEKADAEKKKAEEEKSKKVEAAQKEIDNAKEALDKAKEGTDEKAKIDAEIAFKKAQIKKAQIDENDELVKGLTDDVVELEKKKADLPDAETPKEPEDPKKEALKKEIEELESGLNDLNAKDKKTKDDQNKIDILKASITNKKKQLKEE